MYHGDVTINDNLDLFFTTVSSSGVPTTLAGTPIVSAYFGNSVTQLTAGITLDVDFDSVTGLNHVRVAALSASGYTEGTDYTLVITTGTVDGSSVVGYVVGSFSINHRAEHIVDDTLNRALSGHTTGGTVGAALNLIDDIESQTDDIGVAGAGLTAVPWNAAWDADVQSEVQDAIEANHLDHLLAATYDPAAKPGAADALLNELVEDDAGVSRFTANALEEAPAGGGGLTLADFFDTDSGETYASAVAGSVVKEIADNAGGSSLTLADIADAVWDEPTSEHQTLSTTGRTLTNGANAAVAAEIAAEAAAADTDAILTRLPAALVGGRIDANAGAVSGDATAADTLELFAEALDQATGQIDSGTFQTAAVTADTLATATIVSSKLGASAVTAIADGVWAKVLSEPTGVFNWATSNNTFGDLIQWVGAFFHNKQTQTSTTATLRNDADDADLGTATVSDDGTTATKGEWS